MGRSAPSGIRISSVSRSLFREPVLHARVYLPRSVSRICSSCASVSPQVSFENLFFMRECITCGEIKFKSCGAGGKVTEHTASMEWKPEYESGIRAIIEPNFDKPDYETFNGITIMPLTVNHILLMSKRIPTLTRYWRGEDRRICFPSLISFRLLEQSCNKMSITIDNHGWDDSGSFHSKV